MDALVSALRCRLFFPRKFSGPNHHLDHIFAMLSYQPELATLQLCPYYFDQVTFNLPTRGQVRHTESCNLNLHWFNSWANLEKEKKRAAEKDRRWQLSANKDPRLITGIYLSRLSQLQDGNTSKSLSTEEFIYLMYGFSV